ncbi:MAG TPA: pyridoxal-phosphate dependent enzyme [Patescibacteria group bacterium]|jgi:threonine dehydratase|nr:pyridoxal-phosphate dependent enzyme [Patescibacteria group bacterium]
MNTKELQSSNHLALTKQILSSMLDLQKHLKNNEFILRTPIDKIRTTNGRNITVKREDLQSIGSFKIRGAYNAIRLADSDIAKKGLVTASAGNHSQGFARSAKAFGYPAIAFMPQSTPLTKQKATRALGAKVVLIGANFDEAKAHCLEYSRKHGLLYIPPFDHPDVMAGQATAVLEALGQAPQTTHLYVPVGGGGLLAGAIVATQWHKKHIGNKVQKIIGVEAAVAASMAAAVLANKPINLDSARTIAEGINVRQVGQMAFDIAQQAVNDGLVELMEVDDDEIKQAMVLQKSVTNLMPEGAGATALAGALKASSNSDQKALVISSGCNIDSILANQIEAETPIQASLQQLAVC